MTAVYDSSPTGESVSLTPVQTFYHGKSVFITGGSGFLGKVLIEKLLRSCPGIKTVYILLREKKGKSVEQRMNEITSDVLFNEVRKTEPNFTQRLVIIPGDCAAYGLGISEENRKLIIENVNIVFHAAASVRFDEKLKSAIALNVHATEYILELCSAIKNLDSFCHVSTAYSFCCNEYVAEEVYDRSPCFDRVKRAVKELSDEEISLQLNSILSNWPNTYTLSKAYAESVVKKAEGTLPICIFRPAIVASTYAEPMPGWVDNYLGPTGIVIGAGCGVVRVLHCKKEVTVDIVPVDFVINGILVSSYEASRSFRKGDKKIQVYNYVSSTDNGLNFLHFELYLKKFGITIPSVKAIWYYSLIMCGNSSIHQILLILLHWMPAILVDTAAILLGKQPGMMKLYKKVNKMLRVLSVFTTTQWRFDTHNVRSLWDKTSEEDKKLFNFDIKCLKWEAYLKNYVKGARLHVLKEDMSTLAAARRKWNRLYWYHQIVKTIFFVLVLSIVWLIIKKILFTIL